MKNFRIAMDFSRICRLCLKESYGVMQMIHNNKNLPNLNDLIRDCVNIEISIDNVEKSPNNICSECLNQVQTWVTFRDVCTAANIRLKVYLQKIQTLRNKSQENGSDDSDDHLSDEDYEHSEQENTKILKHEEINVQKSAQKHGRKKKLRTKSERRAIYREKYNQYQRKTYPCDMCDRKFTRFCDLFNHDKMDHEDLPRNSVCNVCGKLFVSDNRVQIHKSRYHCEKPFSCDICDKKFLTKRTLQKHIIIHNKCYTCPYCNLSTSSNFSLIEHIRVHTREKPFTCDECGNSFISQQGLNSHKKTHSSEKLFMCEICGYCARNQSSIYIHKGSHSNIKAFICEMCGKGFKSKIRLNEHHRRHTAVKRFTCDTCNISFRQNYQLIKHLRVHSGEKPYTCDTCNKNFARMDSLKEHSRIHTGEKRYTCLTCLKAFSFLKSFKTHKCGRS